MKDPEQQRLKEMWRKQETAAGRNPDRGHPITWIIAIGAILLGVLIALATR